MDSYIINTPDLQLTQIEFLIRLLVATGIGLIIGLEREHTAMIKKEQVFAGIRTFVFLSMLGFLGAALHFLISTWIFIMVLLAVISLTGISYWITANKGDIGGTTELTAILVVLLGGLTFLGYIEISLMITVIVLVLLSLKLQFKNVIGQITQEELYAFVRFVVVVLLIFPFLPDVTYGPYDVINPREIGWVVILTSGLGFLGYILVRVFGIGKGIFFTGLLGGLFSSTLVTWVFSRKSKEQPTLSSSCAVGILAASSVMMIRVMVWVFLFNRSLVAQLYIPFAILFVAAIGSTLYFYNKDKKNQAMDASIPLGKPLNLLAAFLFGIGFMVVIFIVAYANDVFGQRGIYLTSGIAGLTDLDAITISLSKLSRGSISFFTAQNAILIATVCNTATKFGIALWFGSKEMRKYILIGYGLVFLAAIIAFGILNF